MTELEQDPYIELIAREARRPVLVDPAARDRVMAAVRAEAIPPRSARRASFWSRVIEPRVFTLSPATSTLLAAGLVGIGVLAGGLMNNRDVRQPNGKPAASVAQQLPVSDTVVKFVFLAPQARKVAVVGDFNGWDTTKTPMARAENAGLWSVALPLTAGRHLYAFVVDGTTWTIDPSAPVIPDDGFGHANSVKIVSRGPTL
jgi:hypothetical protein